jgi:hypothetical protein
MTSFIDLIKFKNILISNQIELFDHDLRISHFRLCNLVKNKNQIGGSNLITNGIEKKLNNMSQLHLSHLVNSLLCKNEQKINWILNIY